MLAEFDDLIALADVPAAHKLALAAVAAGEPVLRYGQIIGFATQPIERGEHVHTHNLAMGAFKRDYAFGQDARVAVPPSNPATFQGFVRADGRVATRNYIGIVSTVNCSATVTKLVVEHFSKGDALKDYPVRRRRRSHHPQLWLLHRPQGQTACSNCAEPSAGTSSTPTLPAWW